MNLPKVKFECRSQSCQTGCHRRGGHRFRSLHALTQLNGFIKSGAALTFEQNRLIGVDGIIIVHRISVRFVTFFLNINHFVFLVESAQRIILCDRCSWRNSGTKNVALERRILSIEIIIANGSDLTWTGSFAYHRRHRPHSYYLYHIRNPPGNCRR